MTAKQEKLTIPELPEALTPCCLLELPFAQNQHVVPNVCLQSSLFGIASKGRRKFINGQTITSFKGVTIRYTGEQLDQGDLDVFIHAILITLNITNHKNTENLINFSIRGFLKAIGRMPGRSGQQWLINSIRRLSASNVEISIYSQSQFSVPIIYGGSLIHDYYFDPINRTYFLRVNSAIGSLFDRGWTQLNWKQRLAIKGDLSKWLHGLYSSTDIYPINVRTLLILSGSECKRIADFRVLLRKSLSELDKVGAVQSWKIDHQDKVRVTWNRRV